MSIPIEQLRSHRQPEPVPRLPYFLERNPRLVHEPEWTKSSWLDEVREGLRARSKLASAARIEVSRTLSPTRFFVVGAARWPTALTPRGLWRARARRPSWTPASFASLCPLRFQLLDDGLTTWLATKRWQELDDGRTQVKQPLGDVVSLAVRSGSSFRVRVPVPSS